MGNSDLSLKSLIEGFKLSCQTEGKSSKTIEWYTSFLKRFNYFLEKEGLPVEISSITKDNVKKFIRYLQTEARDPRHGTLLAPTSVQGYVRTLKAFYSWLFREEYIKSNLLYGLPLPKAPIKVVNTFSSEQIGSLMKMCQGLNGHSKRNLMILMILLDTGLRVSELANLEIADIDLKEGIIKIRHAKGNKERLVPIGSLVQKLLWKYINQCRPQPLTSKINNLFLNDQGLSLSKNGIQQMIRRYGRTAGLDGVRCSPHTFRHTFAKNYLLNGGDIFSLQKILGHSSLASVRNYLNLFSVDVKNQHRRYSPVDNFTGIKKVLH